MTEITPSETVKEIAIIATWKNGVFVPDPPLDLPENSMCQITDIRILSKDADTVREIPE